MEFQSEAHLQSAGRRHHGQFAWGGTPALTHRPEWEGAFDLVLVDAPCSGLGVIRKKPDIRYKDPEPLAALPSVQRRILENVSSYVRPGGTLLYSTCTLLRRENENVVSAFLEAHPQFGPEPFQLPGVMDLRSIKGLPPSFSCG